MSSNQVDDQHGDQGGAGGFWERASRNQHALRAGLQAPAYSVTPTSW
jgi:hypothetical protein